MECSDSEHIPLDCIARWRCFSLDEDIPKCLKWLTKLTLTVEIFRGSGGHHCCIRNMLACLLLRSCFWLDDVPSYCVCVFSACNYVQERWIRLGQGDLVTDLWSVADSSQSQLASLGKVSVCANRHMVRWADWPEKWTRWEVELLRLLLGYETRNKSAVKRARGWEEANWRPVLLMLLQAPGHWTCPQLSKNRTANKTVGVSRCSLYPR
jgi:hypothetical protein